MIDNVTMINHEEVAFMYIYGIRCYVIFTVLILLVIVVGEMQNFPNHLPVTRVHRNNGFQSPPLETRYELLISLMCQSLAW